MRRLSSAGRAHEQRERTVHLGVVLSDQLGTWTRQALGVSVAALCQRGETQAQLGWSQPLHCAS